MVKSDCWSNHTLSCTALMSFILVLKNDNNLRFHLIIGRHFHLAVVGATHHVSVPVLPISLNCGFWHFLCLLLCTSLPSLKQPFFNTSELRSPIPNLALSDPLPSPSPRLPFSPPHPPPPPLLLLFHILCLEFRIPRVISELIGYRIDITR